MFARALWAGTFCAVLTFSGWANADCGTCPAGDPLCVKKEPIAKRRKKQRGQNRGVPPAPGPGEPIRALNSHAGHHNRVLRPHRVPHLRTPRRPEGSKPLSFFLLAPFYLLMTFPLKISRPTG